MLKVKAWSIQIFYSGQEFVLLFLPTESELESSMELCIVLEQDCSTFMHCLFYGKLKEDFDLRDSAVTKAFIKVKTVSSELFIRSFQFLSFRSSLIL